ncbi:glycosyltransferase family 4 protein [Rhizorhapis suberifaciens]|uniref:Glycosyltransferase involved in cell wall biosynthesis n=1 Tax=Rhizorhapis suberifaciens TaxID=13656 RepID=A0A840HRP0_9SPHN|nr:glycosyltransferase family 4 protein [Rhizorhapis suberifaciens]MBB4640802.1 glycosyltransferase involved in cell wall biosynthesis [Rhizorhapis suberifaciens]
MNEFTSLSQSFAGVPDHIAIIGNSVPRRCGIATFTTDTVNALRARFPGMRIDLYAMDDGRDDLAYPAGINTISQFDPSSYVAAAQAIEASEAKAIWLQHEYGIFGGVAGDMLLKILHRTDVPLLTTLHTVLERPDPDQRRVLDAVIRRSAKLIVMSQKGYDILLRVHAVPAHTMEIIPHGVPDRPYVEPDSMKPAFGFEGRKILLTFGLIAPDKGIDHMIRAMPAIVEQHPDALYVVLGATHPNVLRRDGEALREALQASTEKLGVADHVRFVNTYVGLGDLLDYLQAADVYVTPYNNPAQITSGTLSYAIGLGKPVVSTPYVHATEILDKGHGILVGFHDSDAMAREINALLSDDNSRAALAAKAYACGRTMLWSKLAQRAALLLGGLGNAPLTKIAPATRFQPLPPNLSAVIRMTDATGMLQHSIYSVPDRTHGYCLDDNARALILMSRMPAMDEGERDRLTSIYASFVQHAWNAERARFRNFMRFDRSWIEEEGSEDSFGRAVWAIGATALEAPAAKHRDWACALFDKIAGPARDLGAPRAQAFVMLGAAAMQAAQPGHALSRQLLEEFGEELLSMLHESRRPDWAWFEAVLAYDNARLPETLLRAGKALGRSDFLECGLTTLEWIVGQQTAPEGHFRAVGTDSFGREYQSPLPFDQQPLEAQATIDACAAAFEVTGNSRWSLEAEKAYQWFLGRNDLDIPLSSRDDGGCYDGLMPTGVNRNQGAESVLALQLASCAIFRLSQGGVDVAHRAGVAA